VEGERKEMGYKNIEYRLIKSKRSSIAIEIKKDCTVVVRCPQDMKKEDIEKYVYEKRNWIESNIKRINIYKKGEDNKLTYDQIEKIINEANDIIPMKVHTYAEKIGVNFNNIRIKKQKTCWGSCSCKGNLNFNCLLMLMPERVRDYVIVHELCHIKEMNHSDKFWSEVETILPDYQWDRRWLRDNGNRIMAKIH